VALREFKKNILDWHCCGTIEELAMVDEESYEQYMGFKEWVET
jgi:hypothetical protein